MSAVPSGRIFFDLLVEFRQARVFRGARAESCSNREQDPKNLMRIIPTKGEKR